MAGVNKERAVKAGGIEAMAKIISAHINNPDVCCQSCNILDILIPDEGKAPLTDKTRN